MKTNYYSKWRRIIWCVLVLNAAIAVTQLFFSYGHYLKHEYWMMLLSITFCCLNGYVAYTQTNNLKSLKQQERDRIINILTGEEFA